MTNRRHVFISHHHADDAHVDKLAGMLRQNGHDIRNSSIRAKPANQDRIDRGLVADATIRRLLRMKMSWAGTVIVLIGRNTHQRPWVNWEIETASRLGKRIVGLYVRGGTEADKPTAFERHGDALVSWNSKSVMAAVDGSDSPFQAPDGQVRSGEHALVTSRC